MTESPPMTLPAEAALALTAVAEIAARLIGLPRESAAFSFHLSQLAQAVGRYEGMKEMEALK